jgi:hypothetical protein
MPTLSFHPILEAALADYSKQLGIDLAASPLTDSFRSCGSPDSVLGLLEDKAKEFKEFRDGNRKLLTWLRPVDQVVHALSAVFGPSISLVSYIFSSFFPPSIPPPGFRTGKGDIHRNRCPYRSTHHLILPSSILYPRCSRQPVVSARATMRSSTCLNVSEIFSNASGSTVIFP